MFTRLFGPSLFLMILDLFLDNPDDLMNMREIARRLDRNPGSIIRVLPRLVVQDYILFDEVGKNRKVYKLNKESPMVVEFNRFRSTLSGLSESEV